MGFQKAVTEQAFLKAGIYGAAGSGKTFTALLIAEGLARLAGKRVAMIQTERGADFYCTAVPARNVHPEAFDFDVVHTKSITDALAECRGLDTQVHGVLIVDSLTHLWEACKAAYKGRLTKAGTIPFQAWGRIKQPWKDLVTWALNAPLHVLLCGRQGNEYAEDDDSGELKNIGFKMRAEGETPYEPHILIRLESQRDGPKGPLVPVAHVEKDRTGMLMGKPIAWPSFDNLARPLLGLLGGTQAQLQTDAEVSQHDAEQLARLEREQAARSAQIRKTFVGRFQLAAAREDLDAVSAEIDQKTKAKLLPGDLQAIRDAYAKARAELLGEIGADMARGR